MPTFERPTVTLHYEDTGGDGPALVFLHGWCDSAESWASTIEAFRSGFRCIAPDMRGHGQS
ncbi:MAG: alpha/beta fold hydrolase, partial [Tepidiformaceae bacterium]